RRGRPGNVPLTLPSPQRGEGTARSPSPRRGEGRGEGQVPSPPESLPRACGTSLVVRGVVGEDRRDGGGRARDGGGVGTGRGQVRGGRPRAEDPAPRPARRRAPPIAAAPAPVPRGGLLPPGVSRRRRRAHPRGPGAR